MALLTYILILHLLHGYLSKTCVIDNTPDYITWEEELMKVLVSDYNGFNPPGENTIVNVTYVLKSFSYDDKTETMRMKTWMSRKWNDERLKWDPEKHHGIHESDVSQLFIWTPYFGLSNADDTYGQNYYLTLYRYELKSNGDVNCRHSITQEAPCGLKLTNWPFDLQECTYKFESLEYSTEPWTGKPKPYTLNFDFHVFETIGAGWYIYDYKHVRENGTKNQVKLTIFLMRNAVGLAVIVVWPALVLTVLSVLSLCLDVRRKVRLAIICLSLYGHYYFLTELAYDVPKETHFPPTLLLYYRGSLVLTIIIVFSTFFLDIICKLKSTPHNYVKLINDFVYENNYRIYLVFSRWDFDDVTVDSKSSSEDWVKFANIVNSIIIFIVIFTYIGLYVTNIPQPTIHHTDFY